MKSENSDKNEQNTSKFPLNNNYKITEQNINTEQEGSKKALRLLEGSTAVFYSSGILGQILPSTLINSFLSIFWIYAVGLDAALVGYATAAGSVANALSAVLFGYLSDQKRPTKFGKRKIFIISGTPFLVVCSILMWIVPYVPNQFGSQDLGLFLYILIQNVVFYIGYACIRSSYLAMLPEQSEDDANRIKISGQQGLFSIVATVLAILLPMILMSNLDNPDDIFNTPQDQEFLMNILPILGIIFAILSLVFTLTIVFVIKEDFLFEEAKKIEGLPKEKKKFKDVILGFLIPFRDIEYLKWLLASFTMNIAMRMMVKSLTPYFTFVLELEGNAFIFYIMAAIPFAGMGFVYWQKKAKKSGLKNAFVKSTMIIMGSLAMTIVIIPIGSALLKQIVGFIFIAIAISSLVGGYILPNPIISALSDNTPEELKDKKNSASAGNYFGSFLFMLNIANALGDVILGGLMAGERAKDPLIIGLLFPVCALFYLCAALIFRTSKLEN